MPAADDRIERSRLLYEQAIFTGDASALAEADRELDAVEAGLALAQGRREDARALAGEAQSIAESAGARTIARQVAEARRQLG